MTASSSPSLSATSSAPQITDNDRGAHSYVAHAYDIEGGQLVYTEHHEETWKDDSHVGSKVEYRDADGEVIAVKDISYASGGATPTFEMEDLRDGYREGAKVESDSVRLYGRRAGEERQETTLALPESAVIDAGFHYFIQDHWEALAGGETRTLDFAIPIRGKFYGFRVRPMGQVEGSDGRQLLKMRFELSNPVYRFLADPIQLTYDIERQRLRVYEGRSNIRDDSGEIYTTRIVFAYPDEEGEGTAGAVGAGTAE